MFTLVMCKKNAIFANIDKNTDMTTENTPIEETKTEEPIVDNSVKEEETPVATPAEDYVISVNNADVYQDKNLILNKVSLHIRNGELVYLVGKTGSGKSNLLKLLYCDVPVVNGEVKVADFDLYKIKSRNIQKLRRQLGIVFQDFQLLQDRNVYENLKFITKVTGWKDKTAHYL